MKYWEFLLVFIVPWLILGSLTLRLPEGLFRRWMFGVLFLTFMALSYTSPWDNYLVKTGIWSYPESRVLGRIGFVPIEEYMFFILQTCLVAIWFIYVVQRVHLLRVTSINPIVAQAFNFFLLALIVFGFTRLQVAGFEYTSLILVWALPVVLLQWFVGAAHIMANWRLFIYTVLPPTLYLWVCDLIAIDQGIWTISPEHIIGLSFWGLPFEEALFFLLTNVMVTMGLILFLTMDVSVKALFGRIQTSR